ncbi:MAG: hypothetical protein LBI45_09450 [Bacteroidales bacterium]|jgi:hypothetical protein|nr:hypothetical protein [Bacteroidales bacterium]
MLKLYSEEVFKEITLEYHLQLRYAISNYGRLVSFKEEINEGRIIKGSLQDGYRIWRYLTRDKKNRKKYKHKFYYRLVAEYFIPKTSDEQIYILHLDRNRANDHINNLKWATKEEMLNHAKKSPFVIEARKKQLAGIHANRVHIGNKLTSTDVMLIKKILLNPNRKTRLKILAKRFGVSEMTLHRIRTGESWGHITI